MKVGNKMGNYNFICNMLQFWLTISLVPNLSASSGICRFANTSIPQYSILFSLKSWKYHFIYMDTYPFKSYFTLNPQLSQPTYKTWKGMSKIGLSVWGSDWSKMFWTNLWCSRNFFSIAQCSKALYGFK